MINIERVSIIGLGLMGGSLALALKNRGFRGKIVGYDICKTYRGDALKAGAIDVAASNIREAVTRAGLVIIAVPISKYEVILKEIGPFLSPNCIVTDLGSIKAEVLEKASRLLPKHTDFIGGHPMTGSERGGFTAADPFLYENAYYFLTPGENTSSYALRVAEDLVKSLGAYAICISAKEHDLIVARISHLPHIIAMTLVNFMDYDKGISYLPFVGGGFRDTTRIASGNPEMWKGILLANKDEIIESIRHFQLLLDEFKDSLEDEEGNYIVKSLENAKSIRDSIPQKRRDYIAPVFEIVVSVEDRPGTIAELTQLISKNNINIKQIEILHSRQTEGGALRLVFESQRDRKLVLGILDENGFNIWEDNTSRNDTGGT